MKKISEGAEAEIFESNAHGLDAIVKVRVSKSYRVPKLDEEIRVQRTKSEARIMARASDAGAMTPRVLMLNKYEIFMNRIKGKTLNVLLKEGRASKEIIEETGTELALLHMSDIAHGDYTPANIIANEKVYVIDFGLSEITNSDEEKALDLLLMKRSLSKADYKRFIDSYLNAKGNRSGKLVASRLEEIERRGRYQTRTLLKT